MDCHVRDGIILGIVCPTNPSVAAKHKWFLEQHSNLEISLEDFCEAVHVWHRRHRDFAADRIEGKTFIEYCRLAGYAYNRGEHKPLEADVDCIRDCV